MTPPIVNEGSYPLGAADEAPHPAAADLLWNESYYLDFVTADGTAGGYVRLGLYPNWGRAWYWACLVREGHPAVTIVDHDVPLPGDSLTVAGRDFEAGYAVTQPLELARATLESARLGLDLQWQTAGGVYGYSLVPRYEVPCTVTGTVRVERGGDRGVRASASATTAGASATGGRCVVAVELRTARGRQLPARHAAQPRLRAALAVVHRAARRRARRRRGADRWPLDFTAADQPGSGPGCSWPGPT